MCYCNIRLFNGADNKLFRDIENIPGVIGLVRHTVKDEKEGKKREEILVSRIGPISQIIAEISREGLDKTIRSIEEQDGVMEAKIIDKLDGRLLGEKTREIESGIS